MNMIEVKTAELSGPALDYAVAVAVGESSPRAGLGGGGCVVAHGHTLHRYCPSTEWSHGGPLIVSRMVAIDYPRPLRDGELPKWVAQCWRPYGCGSGESPLIAACRAIVAAKLGDTVQIPAELLP